MMYGGRWVWRIGDARAAEDIAEGKAVGVEASAAAVRGRLGSCPGLVSGEPFRMRRSFGALAAAVALCASTASLAADRALSVAKTSPQVPTWTYIAMPYAWLPSVKGTTTVKGRSTDIDATFGDLLDREIPEELFGLMGAFEARRGPFAIMTDLVYMKVGVSDGGARVRSVHPQIGGALAASASLQFEMVIAEAALSYELFRWEGAAPGTGTSIDLYGGGRFWWQNADASLALTAGLSIADLTVSRGRAVAASGDVTWFDPLVGLRLRHHFSPGTELVLRADVGGFGVGSDFSWQAMGYVNWEFTRTQSTAWSGMLGYRALQVDFAKGSGRTLYQYDMLTHGPIVGVTARF